MKWIKHSQIVVQRELDCDEVRDDDRSDHYVRGHPTVDGLADKRPPRVTQQHETGVEAQVVQSETNHGHSEREPSSTI